MSVKAIPPMSLPRALLFFSLPLLMMGAIFWVVIPLIDLMGIRIFNTWMIAISVPMVVLLLLAFRFYRKEGHPWDWDHLRERFRLLRMNGMDWVWAFGLALFLIVSRTVLSFTTGWVSARVAEPKFLFRMLEEDPTYFMEMPLQGNWFLLGGTFLMLLLVVVGQELWLRGYILPRQELVHGSGTWIVHGLLWATWYLFLPWQFLRHLPGALALAYVAQRRQNTWTAVVGHFAMYLPILGNLSLRVIER